MRPIGTTLFALAATPALLLATAGAPAVAAPPAPPAVQSPKPETASATAAATAPSALRAQLHDAVGRLDRLRRDAAAFRAQVQLAADEIPPTAAARFDVRLSQMERSIRELTGKIEDLAYKVKQAEKFQASVDERLKALEQGRTAPPGKRTDRQPDRRTDQQTDRRNPPPSDRTAVPVTLPEGPPAEQYGFAIGLLRKARYTAAAAAFKQFIRLHPRHRLAGNAHYWLGEAYYVQGDYRQAAIQFADGFQKFPKHAKAPDILLKLGMTMAKLNKNQEACATLAELRRRFPKASNHVRRAAAAERRRLGCSA